MLMKYKKELYINIKDDYNLLEMLLSNYGFMCKKEYYIWLHPFVITDRGCDNLSFSNVRLTSTKNNTIRVAGMFHIVLK